MKLMIYDGTQWNEANSTSYYSDCNYLYEYEGDWPTQQDYPPQLIIYQYDSYSGWQQT